jgi:hypothetical protein
LPVSGAKVARIAATWAGRDPDGTTAAWHNSSTSRCAQLRGDIALNALLVIVDTIEA